MRKEFQIVFLFIFLMSFLLLPSKIYATWSIVVLDKDTKTTGIAGASCTFNVHGIGRYIPGKGVILGQAYGNRNAGNKAIAMIREGSTPEEIIKTISNPTFDKEIFNRQYAAITFEHYDNPATFTGDEIKEFSKSSYTAPGVSVQGNSLASEKVLLDVFKAVLKARKKGLKLENVLMRALEAGSKSGGDVRCGRQTARSAFINVAGEKDFDCSYLDLRVYGINKGGQNAVSLLKKELKTLKKKLPNNKCTEVYVVPQN